MSKRTGFAYLAGVGDDESVGVGLLTRRAVGEASCGSGCGEADTRPHPQRIRVVIKAMKNEDNLARRIRQKLSVAVNS